MLGLVINVSVCLTCRIDAQPIEGAVQPKKSYIDWLIVDDGGVGGWVGGLGPFVTRRILGSDKLRVADLQMEGSIRQRLKLIQNREKLSVRVGWILGQGIGSGCEQTSRCVVGENLSPGQSWNKVSMTRKKFKQLIGN